jgi:uncharacterized protein (TIGR03435 family)
MQTLDTGQDWIQRGDLRFDVEAKAENPASATRQQLLTMLQNLLVERFQIKFHQVTKEEPGFVLLVAKNGPKLRPSTSEEPKLTFIGPNGEELGKPVSRAIKGAFLLIPRQSEIVHAVEARPVDSRTDSGDKCQQVLEPGHGTPRFSKEAHAKLDASEIRDCHQGE